MRTPNLIHGLTLDVAYDGETETSESLADWLRAVLLPVVDSVLAEHDRQGQLCRIDRLEIDLGTVTRDNAEDELARQLQSQLADALRWQIAQAPAARVARPAKQSARPARESAKSVQQSDGPMRESTQPVQQSARPMQESAEPVQQSAPSMQESAQPARRSARPAPASQLDDVAPVADGSHDAGAQLLQFLRSGRLPWAIAADPHTAHEQLLRQVLAMPTAARVLQSVAHDQHMLTRLVRQYNTAMLQEVAAVLHPHRPIPQTGADAPETFWLAALQGQAPGATSQPPDPALSQFRDWKQRKQDLPAQKLSLAELQQWLMWWLMHDATLVNQDCSLMLESIHHQCAQMREPVRFMRLVLAALREGVPLDLEALAARASQPQEQAQAVAPMDAITSLQSHQAIRNFIAQQALEQEQLGNLNSAQLHQLVRGWIGGTSSVFLTAIENHALQAADAHAYFRGILGKLLDGQAIDLETLAAPASAPHTATSPEVKPADAASAAARSAVATRANTASEIAQTTVATRANTASEIAQTAVATPANAASEIVQTAVATPAHAASEVAQTTVATPANAASEAAQTLVAAPANTASAAIILADATPIGAVSPEASPAAAAPAYAPPSVAKPAAAAGGGAESTAATPSATEPVGAASPEAGLMAATPASAASSVATPAGAVRGGAESASAMPVSAASESIPPDAAVPAVAETTKASQPDVAVQQPARPAGKPSPLPAPLQQSLPQRLASALLQADLRLLEIYWPEITRHHADVLTAAAQRYLRRPQERAQLIAHSPPDMLVAMLKAIAPAIGDMTQIVLQYADACNAVLPNPLEVDEFRQRTLNFAFQQALEGRQGGTILGFIATAQGNVDLMEQVAHAWRAILPSMRELEQVLFGDRYLQVLNAEDDDIAPALQAMLAAEVCTQYPELLEPPLLERLAASGLADSVVTAARDDAPSGRAGAPVVAETLQERTAARTEAVDNAPVARSSDELDLQRINNTSATDDSGTLLRTGLAAQTGDVTRGNLSGVVGAAMQTTGQSLASVDSVPAQATGKTSAAVDSVGAKIAGQTPDVVRAVATQVEGRVSAEDGSAATQVAGVAESVVGSAAMPVAGAVKSAIGSAAPQVVGAGEPMVGSAAMPVAGAAESVVGSVAIPVAEQALADDVSVAAHFGGQTSAADVGAVAQGKGPAPVAAGGLTASALVATPAVPDGSNLLHARDDADADADADAAIGIVPGKVHASAVAAIYRTKPAAEAEAMLAVLLMRAEPLGQVEQLAAELLLQRVLRAADAALSGALETALSQPAAIERLAGLAPAPVLAQLLVRVQPALAAQLPAILRAVAGKANLNQVPAMQTRSTWRTIYQAALVAADPVTPAEFIRTLMREFGGSELAPPQPAPAAATPQDIMKSLLQPVTAKPAGQPETSQPAEQESTGESNIRNAGMVIIATYAQRLFSILELTKDGQFISEEATQRAVHLLQYAITGATATPEYQLTLNKLLCGIHGGKPIARGIDITDKEKDTIEQMLNGVIAHWKALGKTSIAGLRQTFLQREGSLHFEDDAWHLHIPSATFDMLLDRLPWSFAMIRFPWMEHPLQVTWR